MRYLNLIHGSKRDLAIRTDGGIITLGMLGGLTGSRYANARSTDDVIRRPKVAEKIVSDFVKHRNRLEKESLQESEVRFLPCVIKPGKIVCVGLNYRKHAQEIGVPLPQFPVIFSKFSESVDLAFAYLLPVSPRSIPRVIMPPSVRIARSRLFP